MTLLTTLQLDLQAGAGVTASLAITTTNPTIAISGTNNATTTVAITTTNPTIAITSANNATANVAITTTNPTINITANIGVVANLAITTTNPIIRIVANTGLQQAGGRKKHPNPVRIYIINNKEVPMTDIQFLEYLYNQKQKPKKVKKPKVVMPSEESVVLTELIQDLKKPKQPIEPYLNFNKLLQVDEAKLLDYIQKENAAQEDDDIEMLLLMAA